MVEIELLDPLELLLWIEIQSSSCGILELKDDVKIEMITNYAVCVQ